MDKSIIFNSIQFDESQNRVFFKDKAYKKFLTKIALMIKEMKIIITCRKFKLITREQPASTPKAESA